MLVDFKNGERRQKIICICRDCWKYFQCVKIPTPILYGYEKYYIATGRSILLHFALWARLTILNIQVIICLSGEKEMLVLSNLQSCIIHITKSSQIY